jgi:acyl-CoA dehydrogenase
MNALKVGASRASVQAIGLALEVCGLSGYRTDTNFSLGRHLRDAHSAALMVSNDRILGNTAQMLLVQRVPTELPA